ncbi:YpdA family putative bacillithiol disulfide reductase [Paenibacillus zeisoli]|uniref:YpdA family putative bacillithiol disulfide reductase n=1 Tax=Paenibacillus zeisoli TaxID=2496267 RepID=A0A433X6W2_9BACL|nr:YpdA family putative bacillithiol disulfide reductase [Paenibacillus zeisoli]RUT29814.1 YpdA family putative bacillithiol disulfide reductase [Paenibacillus zeisoli]
MEDVIIIGAGPCGLSAAIECQLQGLSVCVIEKYNIVHSIYLYPTHMQFFSTSELLEIGGIPFVTTLDKPYRHEALAYYRRVASHYNLRVNCYEEALSIDRQPDGTFIVRTLTSSGVQLEYPARNVILSSGYFDHPNILGIPGEDTEKVTHYFREAHPYTGMKVAIIGGSNSAVDAAMELLRVGAEVTIVYRGEGISSHIKPWVKPIFEAMLEKERIHMRTSSRVVSILPDRIVIESLTEGTTDELENDFVLALTGFRPDRKLLASAGVQMSEDMDKPVFNPETMESNIPGLYIAGVVASGRNANEVFIESGRGHGKLIARHIARAPLSES